VSGTTVRALFLGRFGQKMKNRFKRYDRKANKNISNYKGGNTLWAADFCSWVAFAQPAPVSSISLGRFFSDRVIWG